MSDEHSRTPSTSGEPPRRGGVLLVGRLPFSGRIALITALALIVIAICAGVYLLHWQRVRDELLSRCKELQSKKNWVELVKAADDLSKMDPSCSESWVMKAIACEETKDVAGMVSSIASIPENDSRFVDFNLRKVLADFNELNRPWDGLKTCDRILEVNSLVTAAHSQAIDFCLLTLQRAEMVKRIRRAIVCRRERPEDYVYLVSATWMNHPSMYAANSHWLQGDPNSEQFQVALAIPIYYSKAKESNQADRFTEVPPHAQLLSRFPQNLELLVYLIHSRIEDGDLEGVQSVLERLPKTPQAEQDARIWRARAWCEDSGGHLELAAEHLQRAYQCDPYWWQVHYELYENYRRSGNQKLANHFYELYDIGHNLSGGISIVVDYINKNLQNQEINLSSNKFLAPIRDVAQMIGDQEIAAAIQARLMQMQPN